MVNVLVKRTKVRADVWFKFYVKEILDEIVNRVCDQDSDVSYIPNLDACARNIRNGESDGLMILPGHGDVTTIRNIKNRLPDGEIKIPVLKLYALDINWRGYDRKYADQFDGSYKEIIESWLKGNFVS